MPQRFATAYSSCYPLVRPISRKATSLPPVASWQTCPWSSAEACVGTPRRAKSLATDEANRRLARAYRSPWIHPTPETV